MEKYLIYYLIVALAAIAQAIFMFLGAREQGRQEGAQATKIAEEGKAHTTKETDRAVKSITDSVNFLRTFPEYIALEKDVLNLQEQVKMASDGLLKLKLSETLATKIMEKEDLEERILSTSQWILDRMDMGASTRLESAIIFYSQGDLVRASSELNLAEMRADCSKLEGIEQRQNTNNIEQRRKLLDANKIQLSNEFVLKAQLSLLILDDPEPLKKASDLYEEALAIDRSPETVLSFASLLMEYHSPEAITLYKEALSLYKKLSLVNREENLEVVFEIERKLGILHMQKMDFSTGELMYTAALSTLQQLKDLGNNNIDHDHAIAVVYDNLANLYRTKGDKKSARRNYARANRMMRKGLKANPEIFKSSLARNMMHIGIAEFYDVDTSMRFTAESIRLFREVVTTDPRQKKELAQALTNHGVLANKVDLFNVTEAAYEEAMKIREGLYSQNPFLYAEEFAYILANYGNFLRQFSNRRILGKKYLDESLKIRRELYSLDPERFAKQLSDTYHNLGLNHVEDKAYCEAANAFGEAVKLLNSVVAKLPYLEQQLKESTALRNQCKILCAESSGGKKNT